MPKRNRCCSCICRCVGKAVGCAVSVIASIVVAGALYQFVLKDFLGDAAAQILVPADPPGRNETLLWRKADGQGGLDVEIVNALEEHWQPYFVNYARLWDDGYDNVDPLTIYVREVDVDPECEPITGKLKVCNADFGETDWRGLNVALTDEKNHILNSVSKYNDFWADSDAQMSYTMCHEMGHGFGLPHTDENYHNLNTGECMDYTSTPRANLNPGQYNFNLLAELYGNAPSSVRLRRREQESSNHKTSLLPERVLREYHQATQAAVDDPDCRHCSVPLSNGYRIRVHKFQVPVS